MITVVLRLQEIRRPDGVTQVDMDVRETLETDATPAERHVSSVLANAVKQAIIAEGRAHGGCELTERDRR